MDPAEVVKLVVSAFTLIATIVGWNVVSKGNDRREQRKEIRSIIGDIRKLVVEIEARAFEYYQLSPEKSRETGVLLKQQLKHLSLHVASLVRQDSRFDITAELVELRSKTTGGDFESIAREPRPSTDVLMEQIALSGLQLIDQIEGIFAKVYSGR